jgi:adenylate cyclase
MKNKIIISLLISILVSSGTLLAYHSNLFERAENIAYDAKVKLYRSRAVPPRNIKVVLVDDASIKALEPVAGRWPWPRAIWADLLDFLSIGGAKAVLFDILFSQRYDEANDRALVEATAAAGNVHHSMVISRETPETDTSAKPVLGAPLPQAFTERFAIRTVRGTPGVRPGEENNDYELPMEQLLPVSRGVAVVEFSKDSDGTFRRTRPVREYQGRYFPVLGIAPFLSETSTVEFGDRAVRINDRTLPLDEDGNYLINMYGIENMEPYSVGGIFASLQKIREGEVQDLIVHPEEFKDSIVFVAASAIGAADLKPTPLASSTPGVILHAALAGNYLQNDFLRPPDRRLTVAMVLAGVFLTAGVVFFSRQFLVRASFPAAFLLLYGWYSFYAFKGNTLVETVPFAFATFMTGFFSFGYLTFTEALEKRRVSQLFTQYVNKDVLNEVLHNYKEYLKSSAGQKVEITVLFSDIRGFTTISETTPPGKIVEMLNIHFSHMADIILKHNGTIDKYIGDAIMAFWGAPVKDELHAEHAVRAGMEMIKELDAVNRELRSRGLDMEIRIGVGINTGEATIGEIGSEKKKNYTIVGDTVNLASRLESITKEYKSPLVFSEYTCERLQGRFKCDLLGNVKVKGRERPVNIYTAT